MIAALQEGAFAMRNDHPLPRMLATELYSIQAVRWPAHGRHLLAQYDANSIVVYQAYRPEIAEPAVVNGCLGGSGFSFNRMSWIKPNFLWMMYRSGWATKKGQDRVLALRLRRSDVERLLKQGVHSSYDIASHANEEEWKQALRTSEVRLQWDPDHSPSGGPL